MNDDKETAVNTSEDNQALSSGAEVPCMLLPLANVQLLLPNVTVAEMAAIQPFDIKPNTPDWFLGFFQWRNVRVPVIAYETMNQNGAPKLNARSRVAILNYESVTDALPYFGILTQDSPKIIHVKPSDIQEDEATPKNTYDLMSVTAVNENAMIPNLESVESRLRALDLSRF